MLSPRQVLFGDLSPQQRRRLRIPLAMVSAVAVTAFLSEAVELGVDAAQKAYNSAETNFGCDTAPIPAHKGVVAGAIAVRAKMNLSSNNELDSALTTAARQAQIDYIADHSGADVYEGQLVEACIKHNPLASESWDNSGWIATVSVKEG